METLTIIPEYRNRIIKLVMTIVKDQYASTQPTFETIFDRKSKLKIVSVTAEPNSKLLIYKYSDGSTKTYNQDQDPLRFINDWKLHNTAFVKDQYYDGLALSDWTYWSQQIRNYTTSLTWGLINIAKIDRREVKRYVNLGVDEFKLDLLTFRGLDIDREQNDEEKNNDFAIAQKQASKAFYDSQSLH